ncbi:MAG: Coenzyme F420 hydrogenase/dehydrogenase, beta subunit C-terminal domain [Candidatus Electrothrix sp. YB6]
MSNFITISYTANELNKELGTFFAALLEKKTVDAVLVSCRQPSGSVMQTLITDPAQTAQVDPFAPVVPVSSARLASSLTGKPSGKKIALVMRACEIRALIELVKLNQATLDDTLLIGLDCFGRFENKDFSSLQEQGLTAESFLRAAQSGTTETNGQDIIEACATCEHPVTPNADMHVCVIGAGEGTFGIEAVSEKGKQALADSGISGSSGSWKREDALKSLVAARQEAFTNKLNEYREKINSFQALEENMAKCINCYNCRVACPVCYCKECVFVTDTFRHDGEQFLGWAQQKGSLKMPTDTVFYHLTRMTHIGNFCVGCGQCTSACPNDVNLTLAFKAAAKVSQERFEYEAGRSLDEPQPLTVFHHDELMEVTGQAK